MTNENGGIRVLEGTPLRSGTRTVLGRMTASVLAEHRVVPRRNFRDKTGYQREPSKTRVNRLKQDLDKKRVDLPTAVLLNLRAFNPDSHLVRKNGSEYLSLRAGDRLYVVDGQHRIEALTDLYEDDPDRWAGFELPFVCLLGAHEGDEMEQFYVVNSTAKSVRTDLALDLLKQRAEADPTVRDSLMERGESWKVDAQTIVERLALTPAWSDRVRFPGQSVGETTIANSGMVNGLKQLLLTPYFGNITTDNQVKILDAYWRAIRDVLPEAFEEPTDYTLQKMTGVTVMHGLLIVALEYVRSAGGSVIEAESYRDALSGALEDLEGDTREGEVVRGADFWRAGPRGAAGSFSSNAGRRVLLAKLKTGLPAFEVE
ncbi:MAG: DGQHR domain-containing protein [Chloroflexi bacterium]|nr:DGQHR domain-containing protein [Chloroflexota bacterium]